MGILTRTLQKFRNDASDGQGKEAKTSNSLLAKELKETAQSGEVIDSETGELPEIEIDIRLDEDLSDYVEQSKYARSSDPHLDFDLTHPGNRELSLVETQVLKIDTSKSFSHQIDVDLKKLGMAGFITPDNSNIILSNTFRQLKRPVLNNVIGKGATVLDNANLIMVTSSLAGEGKTFTAVNMAMSIAMEADKRVLLVDADVSKPSHHEYFGVEMKSGLTDLLMGRVEDVSRIIYKTNIPSLSLIFSGSRTPHATELFASNMMGKFINELSKRYEDRVIVFDSAPLLLPTEASVLASHMGQIILVIEAEQTEHELVKHSLEMLSNRIILLVLNKVRKKSDLGVYGYYGKNE